MEVNPQSLAIPRLRQQGSYFPSISSHAGGSTRPVYAVVMEAYLSGMSTRSVDALVESMGAAPARSPSREVSVRDGSGCSRCSLANSHRSSP